MSINLKSFKNDINEVRLKKSIVKANEWNEIFNLLALQANNLYRDIKDLYTGDGEQPIHLDMLPSIPITDLGGTDNRVFYINNTGTMIELALGADGTYLKSNGTTSAPTFDTPPGAAYDVFTMTVNGLVPAPTEEVGKYLKDDGTWDNPPDTQPLDDAEDINYDNEESGLAATNVQAAIDEIISDIITNVDDFIDSEEE